MKTIHKRLAVIGLSALLFTSAGTALAFGGSHERHGCDNRKSDRWHSPMRAISQLDGLTDEQRNQLKQIRRDARDAMRDVRDEMRDNRSDLRDARVDNADLETIRSLAKKQGDQVARMIVLRAEIRDKISNLLTEAQRQQLAELLTQRWGGNMPRQQRQPGWDGDMPRERMRY
ncbi:MAG: Spy/CpxP family protein refolding chaperone [Candidatus Thiodiazotropha sp.]